MNNLSSPNSFLTHKYFEADDRVGHLIIVSGTYYDMGKMIGKELGKEFTEELHSSFPGFRRKVSVSLNRRKEFNDDIAKALEYFVPRLPLNSKQEMLGLYEGCRDSGFPLNDPLLLEKVLIVIELAEIGCSLFAVNSPMSRINTYQFHDLDYYTNLNMKYIPTVILRIPQSIQGNLIDIPYITFDFLPNISGGVYTGINEAGIVVSLCRGAFTKRSNFSGMPIKCLVQNILRSCTSAVEAIEYIKRNPPAADYYAIISDPQEKNNSLQFVLMGPKVLYYCSDSEFPDLSILNSEKKPFYKLIKGAVYWTEMEDRQVDTISSTFELEDMYHLLNSHHKKFDLNSGVEVAKIVSNDATFISALFDTTNLIAKVAFADRKHAAHKNNFIHFDLKELFEYKNRLTKES
jgi:hypothetical protein